MKIMLEHYYKESFGDHGNEKGNRNNGKQKI